MRMTMLALIAGLSVAGCTNYVPVPQGQGSWEEARLAPYNREMPRDAAAAPAADPRASASARATDEPVVSASPSSSPASTRAETSLEPKPLPPLRTTSSAAPGREASRRDEATREAEPRTTVAAADPRPDREPRVAAPADASGAAPDAGARRAEARPAAPAPDALDADLTPPALSGVGFLWPVPAVGDTARVVDVGGEGALAIEAPAGERFVASENGVVVFAGDGLEAFGHMVVVRHDGDYTTAYGHAERLDVAVGDVVRRGQALGLVGRSGEVADPQLYFEMRVGSRVVDPRAYLVGAPRLAARD